jgi:hypothetical protein
MESKRCATCGDEIVVDECSEASVQGYAVSLCEDCFMEDRECCDECHTWLPEEELTIFWPVGEEHFRLCPKCVEKEGK